MQADPAGNLVLLGSASKQFDLIDCFSEPLDILCTRNCFLYRRRGNASRKSVDRLHLRGGERKSGLAACKQQKKTNGDGQQKKFSHDRLPHFEYSSNISKSLPFGTVPQDVKTNRTGNNTAHSTAFHRFMAISSGRK